MESNYKQQAFSLSGQVALVTGAARGIGRACALALTRAGADIILGLRRKESGEALAGEIRAIGRQALPVLSILARKCTTNPRQHCTRDIRQRCTTQRVDAVVKDLVRGSFLKEFLCSF